MTDEQINRAIAETCGWKSKEETNGNPWLWMRTKADSTVESLMEPPDYCADLNAMHKAEMILPIKKMMVYVEHLRKKSSVWFCAEARVRAEAFLRTLGKWEEVQG